METLQKLLVKVLDLVAGENSGGIAGPIFTVTAKKKYWRNPIDMFGVNSGKFLEESLKNFIYKLMVNFRRAVLWRISGEIPGKVPRKPLRVCLQKSLKKIHERFPGDISKRAFGIFPREISERICGGPSGGMSEWIFKKIFNVVSGEISGEFPKRTLEKFQEGFLEKSRWRNLW